MSQQRTWPLLIVVALLLLPTAAYVASYLAMCRTITTYANPGGTFGVDAVSGGRVNSIHRFYDYSWQVAAFVTAGKLEGAIRGVYVETLEPPQLVPLNRIPNP